MLVEKCLFVGREEKLPEKLELDVLDIGAENTKNIQDLLFSLCQPFFLQSFVPLPYVRSVPFIGKSPRFSLNVD